MVQLWAASLGRHVVEDPRPTLCLGQGGVADGVHTADRPHGQRLAIVATVGSQTFVEGVHHHRSEVADQDVAETGLEMALDDGMQISDRRGRPARASSSEPQVEQLPHRRAGAHGRSNVCMGREGLELSEGVSSVAVACSRQPAALPGAPINAGIDPELEAATPPLAYRTFGRIHRHSVVVMTTDGR
jgi:hypothetical protein